MSQPKVEVLALGLTLRLRARVQGRLTDCRVRSVRALSDFRHCLINHSYSLLIVNENFIEGAILSFFAEFQPLHTGPTVLLAQRRHHARDLRTLVGRYRVEAILYAPIDSEELVRALAKVLDLAINEPLAERSLSDVEGPSEGHRALLQARIDSLTEFAAVEAATDTERQKAERLSRQLIGGIGAVGFKRAELLAREVYNLVVQSGSGNNWPRRRLKRPWKRWARC